jgi:sigma54-dependent transcription regulator
MMASVLRKQVMVHSEPLCEVCGRNAATVFVGFGTSTDPTVRRWQFTCASERAADETEFFSMADFFASPTATVDRLAHLHESGRIDWTAFMDMIVRLRTAMAARA